MKRKRKDVCASPPLCESPKRTKIQAQRKFAQNSGINCPIITPIRDLDISDDPHTSALPAPVELLPMKRPNTEDFLTFLCFRGTPILPSNLQFFNTASIVADGQVHEIKGDCPKNGPIDIAKCASGSSSEKPFIAFGVRKRADPIVISRQMERKRRHAIALQALRRKYQEQKMAKIRALTISKLSEKTTNRTLVKTNTVQKTETSVTKKSSTKVIATRHVKVTTQTLKSKVKPKMCLRSFPGKFIQKELPFRPKRSLPETVLLNAGRTSKNSNKWEEDTATSVNRPIRQPVKAKIKPVGSVVRSSTMTSIKRQQIKRRILVPSTGVTSIIRPKLRSTTLKKTVISRRKAQQRTKSSNRVREPFNQLPAPIKKSKPEEESLKSTPPPQEIATSPSPESPRRLTRRSSDILNTKTKPGQNDKIRRELRKKLEVKREVNVAESVSRRMVKKDLDVKRDFSLKTRNRDIKKNVALHKSCDTVVEKTKAGNKVTLDQKTMEVTTVQRVLTRKAEEAAAKVPHRPVKPEQKKVSKSTEEVKPVSRKAPTRPQSPKTNESQKRKPPIARESKNKREQIPRRQTRDYSSKLAESKDVVVASKVNQDAPKKAESKNMPVASDNAPKNTEKKNEEVPSDVNQDASKKANNDDVIVASKFNQDAFKKAQSKDVIAASKVNQDASEKAESSNMVVASEVNQNAPKKAESKNIVVASKVCKDAPKKTESKNIVALKVNKEASKKVQSKDMVVVDTVNQDALKRAESKYLVVASNVKQDATKKAESEDVAVVSKVNQDVPKKAESKYLVVAANVKQDATKKAESEDVAVVSKVNEDIPKKAESNVLVACKANQNDIKKEDVEESVPPQPKVNINEGEEETRAKELSKTGKDAAKEVLSEVGKVTKESPSSVTSLQKEATPEAKQEIIIEGTNYAKKTAKGLPVAEVKVRTPEPKQQLTTKASGDAKKVALRVQNDSKQDTAKIQSKKLTNKKLVSETTIQSQVISQAKQEILAETKKGSIALSTSQDISEIKQEVVKDITKLLRKPPKRSSVAPQVSTRPTRKSKEAAAIYMEILSHKLVNDNTIDDDNVSIDSFPELPNVKRTEQREIELKAQAKTSKEDDERKPLAGDVSVDKNTNPTDDESDNEVLQAKIAKRRTKREENSQKNDSSDESFRADVKVPMKKKNTRRSIKGSSVLEKNVDIILEAARVLEATPQEDSDETSTSDMNLKSLQVKQRKKLSERTDPKFSDSDEEPLAKFTSKISKPSDQKPVTSRKTADKQLANVTTVMEPKPKRECAKRPSYYLPMMSSSDEDEEPYFHGFSAPKEELKKVQTLVPSLDLLSKDIGRKEKVNMSNEQIEQWLKDSALAGSSVAKENDAMLKFGEKIPVETLKTNTPPRTPNLKLKIEEPRPESSKEEFTDRDAVKTTDVKSLLGDRKWIFKKDKKQPPAPNKNAFSPDNECSVYAFGEDNEEVVSTPFRRPSRRPSSTATSRSEDETSKTEEATKIAQFRKPISSDSENSRCFNVPQNPAKQTKPSKSDSMVPPSSASHPVKRSAKQGVDRHPEPFDDAKYKVPSSPSASSGSSSKLYKKGTQKPKTKGWECVNPVYVSDFPKPTDPAKLVEAPVFHPTEQEFQDPLEYIERVRHKAEQFGICKIVPPSSFKPECKVADDMRFTAYNQYVHKMLHRWGPNFKEFVAIRKYLATQSISLKTPPLIGGMEVDLPRLYQTVQSLGGLKEVIEKKKWSKVSESMKIPKSAQDRVTKLDDIYCKYLLPYDTLSPAEREKLFEEVELYWTKKQNQSPPNQAELNSEQDSVDSDDNDGDSECTIKGKNMALNALYRIARNTMSMYFKVPEPSTAEVEQEFWRYVTQKRNHICVHSASIDCGTWGYGFAVAKNSPFAKHPWNLKVLSNNGGSVLRSLGPVMGVTIPTLHVGMVFSACCWYRDPHGLPWVEYLHTGGTKIWYGIPSTSCDLFRAAMRKLVPGYCREKELWLPSDTAMVPPEMLLEHQVSLCRTVQEPGQFVVVFPKVYTSGICTGYVVSESVYFAPLYWLKTARSLFNDLKTSCEPSMFSLEKLFVSIANDVRSNPEVLKTVLPFIEELCENERGNREKLRAMSPVQEEKIIDSEPPSKKKKILSVDGDLECEICRTNLFVSMVVDLRDEVIYCLEHALVAAEKDEKALSRFKLRYHLDDAELAAFPKRINSSIEGKQQKKLPGKYAGLPTLLK